MQDDKHTMESDEKNAEQKGAGYDERLAALLVVRPIREDDVEAVVALANKAWKPIIALSRERLGDIIADAMRPGGDDVSKGETVRAEIKNAPDTYFVCEHDGKIVGFVSGFMDFKTGIGTVGHNAADKECGIKGIGQCMYKFLLEHFRRNGMKVAKVFTGLDDAHAPARRAYQRAGFNKSLEHVTYYMEL